MPKSVAAHDRRAPDLCPPNLGYHPESKPVSVPANIDRTDPVRLAVRMASEVSGAVSLAEGLRLAQLFACVACHAEQPNPVIT